MNPLIHQLHARRALGICNRLKPGPTKARHSGRILGTLNRVRPAAKRANPEEAMEYYCWIIQTAWEEAFYPMGDIQC